MGSRGWPWTIYCFSLEHKHSHQSIREWFSFLDQEEVVEFQTSFPFSRLKKKKKKKARVKKKFLFLSSCTQHKLIMQMSKVSGRVKSFVIKTQHSKMKNLYCQRVISARLTLTGRIYINTVSFSTATELRHCTPKRG